MSENTDVSVDSELKATLKAEVKAELKAELTHELSFKPDEEKKEEKPVKTEDKKESSCFELVKSKDSVEVKDEVKDEVKEEVKQKPVSSLSMILTICGKALQDDTEVCHENIMVIVHSVMESIEMLQRVRALARLSSEAKRQLCVDCVKWIVNNQPDMDEKEREALLVFVDKIAPNAIDLIASLSNGDSELVLSLVDRACKPFGCMPSLCMLNIKCCFM